jgi:hypothetical protein
VTRQWYSAFVRARFCSPQCYRAVMLPRLREARQLAASARRLPPAEATSYRKGYAAGFACSDARWRRHVAHVDLPPLKRRGADRG